uniref:SNF2_N domain-containing protein n=1 Tax=Heterorhabditis bacteriophora TaxID=37862 RepID=A0A1I7WG99_HETBA
MNSDYQIEGISAMRSWHRNGHGGINGDEMGLGKTCQMVQIVVECYSTYFLRLIILRSPSDSNQANLIVECLCSKSREPAVSTAQRLFWLCKRVLSLV